MLKIDTGTDGYNIAAACRIGVIDATLANIRDHLDPDATQIEIDNAVILAILGDLRTPKTLKTVRRHLQMWWPTLCDISERDAEAFDAVIMEFAELTTVLS